MIATAQDRQSIFDLALQYFGTPEAAFLVADRLGVAITDAPPHGATFEYQADEVADQYIVNYYLRHGIIPTTAEVKQQK